MTPISVYIYTLRERRNAKPSLTDGGVEESKSQDHQNHCALSSDMQQNPNGASSIGSYWPVCGTWYWRVSALDLVSLSRFLFVAPFYSYLTILLLEKEICKCIFIIIITLCWIPSPPHHLTCWHRWEALKLRSTWPYPPYPHTLHRHHASQRHNLSLLATCGLLASRF